jgi:hypothetical protein
MKQALEALEDAGKDDFWRYQNEAITSLRQAIAEAEKQEPVAWALGGHITCDYVFLKETPLYTTPQQRTWVGLTDEDIEQGLLRSDYALQTAHAWRAGVVFAMTQLKEKNT